MPQDYSKKVLLPHIGWARVAVPVILIAAFFLHLTPHWSGFWLDELYTIYFADPDLQFSKKLLRKILDDPQPFPYYLVMWGWHSLVGISETASRILGGGVLIGSLVATIRILEGALPIRTAALIVALLSFSWAGVQFSHEARSYALLYGFACIGYALLLRSLVLGSTNRVTYGMLFVAMAAGASHYYGMVLGCALFIGRSLGFWRTGKNKEAKSDIFLLLILLIFYAALLLPQLSHLADRAGGEFWIKNDPVGLIKGYVALFFFDYLGVIGLGLLIAGAALGARRSPLVNSVLVAVAISFFVPALISLHTPMLLPRYLIITVPPLLMVLALSSCRARPQMASVLGFLAAAFFFLDASYGYFNLEKDSWSSPAALVTAETRQDCVIPVWGWQPRAYGYYLPDYLRASMIRVKPGGPVPAVPTGCRVLLWAAASDGLRLVPPADALVVKIGGSQIWLRRARLVR